MKCDKCGGDTKTKDTRKIEQGIWRRRFCPTCKIQFTTLEQRCETLSVPYTSKKGVVVAPPAQIVDKPRARVKVADPTPKVRRAPPPAHVFPTKTDKTYPTPKVVDRLTPTARDRIEDMKFEREWGDYGWDK